MIYHITSSSEWDLAKTKGEYQTDTLQDDGFIHCSTKDQVLGVANELFAGRMDLVLLCIDSSLVRVRIEYEDLYETNQLYPHIYGEITLDAVCAIIAFPPQSDGTFLLPEGA